MIRVLLVDDQALLRTGFRLVLEAIDDIDVIGEAGDGTAAEQMARALEPDVILMDVRMPGRNGIDATRAITEALPDTKVLILTTFDLDEYAFAGLRAGASGFLLKDTKPADLVEAIRLVASGDAVVSPRVTRRMLELFSDRLPESAPSGEGGVAPGAGVPHPPRLRGAHAHRAGALERRDRGVPRGLRGDRQDARGQRPGQDRLARPGPGRGAGARDRAGRPRQLTRPTTPQGALPEVSGGPS